LVSSAYEKILFPVEEAKTSEDLLRNRATPNDLLRASERAHFRQNHSSAIGLHGCFGVWSSEFIEQGSLPPKKVLIQKCPNERLD
jgi:hypothetical protein